MTRTRRCIGSDLLARNLREPFSKTWTLDVAAPEGPISMLERLAAAKVRRQHGTNSDEALVVGERSYASSATWIVSRR